METTAAQAAEATLRSLTTQPEKRQTSTKADEWDWQWQLTGNETPEESVELARMLGEAKLFVSGIVNGEPPRWLVFLGKPGCGKTHLADRIRWFLKEKDRDMVYYDRHCRATVDPTGSDYLSLYSYAQEGAIFAKWGKIVNQLRNGDYTLYGKACRDHYKVIDDLGVDSFDAGGMATSFAVQKMGELLDQRLGKWTVITSNYSMEDLAKKFDPRIASRMDRGESVVVSVKVRDFNIRKNLKPDDSASSRR